MAKYVIHDSDYKALSRNEIADFNKYMLQYDVDANVETSKGKDVVKLMWDVVRGKKIDMKFKIKNVNDLYVLVYTILMGLDALAFVNIFVFFLYYLVTWLITFNPIRKLIMVILLQIIVFMLGLILIIVILSRLRDNVQSRIEKIVYKL